MSNIIATLNQRGWGYKVLAATAVCFVALALTTALWAQSSWRGLSFEAESGVLAGSVSRVTEADVSGGQAIRFTDSSGWNGNGPNPSLKPTEDSTGPKESITQTRVGGEISGTFNRIHFTGSINVGGGNHVILRNCIIDGDVDIYGGSLVMEDCHINGRLTQIALSKDPNFAGLVIRRTWIEGPNNDTGDLIRFQGSAGGSEWGDNSYYVNVLIEDTALVSNYRGAPGAHFDVLQTGGGRNVTMRRVVFQYTNPVWEAGATAYVNNQTRNPNFTITDAWFEGGPVAYVLGGSLTVTNCQIELSARHYFYVYPDEPIVLNNCYDDAGNPIIGN